MAGVAYLERKRICGMVDVRTDGRTDGRTDNEIVQLYTLMWGSLRLAPINQ